MGFVCYYITDLSRLSTAIDFFFWCIVLYIFVKVFIVVPSEIKCLGKVCSDVVHVCN